MKLWKMKERENDPLLTIPVQAWPNSFPLSPTPKGPCFAPNVVQSPPFFFLIAFTALPI